MSTDHGSGATSPAPDPVRRPARYWPTELAAQALEGRARGPVPVRRARRNAALFWPTDKAYEVLGRRGPC